MIHTQTFSKLSICSLSKEAHERTSGYWYAVQSAGTPHRAFATRNHALRWLANLGLSLPYSLPEPGVHLWQPIIGAYRRSSHMDPAAFAALSGVPVPCLESARYLQGLITFDDDGLRTLHHRNCNLDQPVFDYQATRALVEAC